MNEAEFVPLRTICAVTKGVQFNKRDTHESGTYPVINGGVKPTGYIEQYNQEGETITVAQGGAAGYVSWQEGRFWAGAHCYVLCPSDEILSRYLYHVLKSREWEIQKQKYGTTIMTLPKTALEDMLIPVPPLPVQRKIVSMLDKFTELISLLTKELALRKKQYEYYRNKLLTFGPEIRRITLGEIGKICMCKRIMKDETTSEGDIPFYKIGTFGKKPDAYISREIFDRYRASYPYPRKGEVLISAAGTIGKTIIFDGEDAYFQDSNIVWLANDETLLLNKFLYYLYQLEPWKVTKGGTIKRLYNDGLTGAVVPVPPLEEQNRIAMILNKWTGLISSLKAEIEARTKQYAYYRDKLITFTPKS